MNIFLPYENDIKKSVESLDDKRLNKQIIECHIIIEAIRKNNKTGYINHCVTQFYKNNIDFIYIYGFGACCEYNFRFEKEHVYKAYFYEYITLNEKSIVENEFTPFYSEGSKGKENYIRTTQNVSKLFQDKLNNKWREAIESSNKRKIPTWTNRDKPEFYKVEFYTEKDKYNQFFKK